MDKVMTDSELVWVVLWKVLCKVSVQIARTGRIKIHQHSIL